MRADRVRARQRTRRLFGALFVLWLLGTVVAGVVSIDRLMRTGG